MMKKLKIKYNFRFSGDSNKSFLIADVDVENDSNEKEIDEIIKWYYIKYIITPSVAEIYPHEILK